MLEIGVWLRSGPLLFSGGIASFPGKSCVREERNQGPSLISIRVCVCLCVHRLILMHRLLWHALRENKQGSVYRRMIMFEIHEQTMSLLTCMNTAEECRYMLKQYIHSWSQHILKHWTFLYSSYTVVMRDRYKVLGQSPLKHLWLRCYFQCLCTLLNCTKHLL